MIILEPKWKSYVVETTGPVFTPEQCKMIIEAGRSEPKQTGQVLELGSSFFFSSLGHGQNSFVFVFNSA